MTFLWVIDHTVSTLSTVALPQEEVGVGGY